MPGKTKSRKSGAGAAKSAQAKIRKAKKAPKARAKAGETAEVLSSQVVFKGPLFNVTHDKIIEPGGYRNERDFVRHNGSAVILAVDSSKDKKDPWVVMERQYRYAAGRFLWELPAGKVEVDEDPLAGAQRELAEETGYRAKKWTHLMDFWSSPGFLGEEMKLFLAEGLSAGDSLPEDDEKIELRLVKLSDLLKMIEKGAIQDGKTLTGVLFYARSIDRGRKK